MFMQLVSEFASSAELLKMLALFVCGVFGWCVTNIASRHYSQCRSKADLKLAGCGHDDVVSPIKPREGEEAEVSLEPVAATPAQLRNTERRRLRRQTKAAQPPTPLLQGGSNAPTPEEPLPPADGHDEEAELVVAQEAAAPAPAPAAGAGEERYLRLLAKKTRRKELKAAQVQEAEAQNEAVPREELAEEERGELPQEQEAKQATQEPELNVEVVAEVSAQVDAPPVPQPVVEAENAAVMTDEGAQEEISYHCTTLCDEDDEGSVSVEAGSTRPPSFDAADGDEQPHLERQDQPWEHHHHQQWGQFTQNDAVQGPDGWMMPLEDLQVQNSCCAEYFVAQEQAASDMLYVEGCQAFTDGQAVFEPLQQTDDGQLLYTDGTQIFAAVCIKTDQYVDENQSDSQCCAWAHAPEFNGHAGAASPQHYSHNQDVDDSETWNACWDFAPQAAKAW